MPPGIHNTQYIYTLYCIRQVSIVFKIFATILWQHCIVTALYRDSTVLRQHCIMTALYCDHCIVTALYRDSTVLRQHCIMTALYCDHCIATALYYDSTVLWQHCIVCCLRMRNKILLVFRDSKHCGNLCLYEVIVLFRNKTKTNKITF